MKPIVLLTVLIFMLACTDAKKESSEASQGAVNISPEAGIDNDFYGYLKIKDFSVLHQNESVQLGMIGGVISTDSFTYVMDKVKVNSIAIFDKEGNPVGTFVKKGSGPGESVRLGDFYHDKSANEIVVLSYTPLKRMFFTLDGNHVRDERIKVPAQFMAQLPGTDRVVYEAASVRNHDNKYFFIEQEDGSFSKQVDIHKDDDKPHKMVRMAQAGGGFAQIGENLYSLPLMSDKVYQIDAAGQVEEHLHLDLGEMASAYKNGERESAPLGLSFYRTKDHWIFTYMIANEGAYVCLMDDQSKKKVSGPIIKKSKGPGAFLEMLYRNIAYTNATSFQAVMQPRQLEVWKKMIDKSGDALAQHFEDIDMIKSKLNSIQDNDLVVVSFSIDGI